ncbi:MAG: glucokinase [Pseudomonadota bacterium]
MALLLAADLGGTKSNLALFEDRAGGPAPREEATLTSAEHADACAVVQAFLAGTRVDAAVVAIAGPVLDGRAAPPNLPWVVELAALRRALATDRVDLINDLVATAYGIDGLAPEYLAVLNEAAPGSGAIAVIAAGTGLGEAALMNLEGRPVALPSEGGHADFGPGDDDQIALLQNLARRYGHVSWERVVSGPGLTAIYEFLLETGRGSPNRDLAARMAAGDPSAEITRAALAGSDATAGRALDLFVHAYGAEAGNLALKFLATGGVYLAGGIAPKIVERLRSGPFMTGFLAKGRHADLLRRIPVAVVLEPRTALWGAARRAADLAR